MGISFAVLPLGETLSQQTHSCNIRQLTAFRKRKLRGVCSYRGNTGDMTAICIDLRR
jgi:hypothetical protein